MNTQHTRAMDTTTNKKDTLPATERLTLAAMMVCTVVGFGCLWIGLSAWA